MRHGLRRLALLALGTAMAGTAACREATHGAGEGDTTGPTASTTGDTAGTTGGPPSPIGGGTAVNPNTGIIKAGSSEGEGIGSLEPHPAACSNVCNGNIVPPNNNSITQQYCPPANTPVGSAVPCEGFCFVAESVTPTWNHEPPSSGPVYPHYDYQWGEHTQPLSRGAYVHNLAHGFVILAYNCPDGCADDLATLRAVLQESAGARVILTPDPLLTAAPYAALAWTWQYTFSKPDQAALACFIAQHNTNGWPH